MGFARCRIRRVGSLLIGKVNLADFFQTSQWTYSSRTPSHIPKTSFPPQTHRTRPTSTSSVAAAMTVSSRRSPFDARWMRWIRGTRGVGGLGMLLVV